MILPHLYFNYRDLIAIGNVRHLRLLSLDICTQIVGYLVPTYVCTKIINFKK